MNSCVTPHFHDGDNFSQSIDAGNIITPMRVQTLKHRLIALVLGALFVGLAPLVHAFCVVPMNSAISDGSAALVTTMEHTMADGSSMVMAVSAEASVMIAQAIPALGPFLPLGDHASAADVMALTNTVSSHNSGTSTLGSILVAVGLAILSFFGMRRCAQGRAFFSSDARAVVLHRERWPERVVMRPYSVHLESLGISRT